MRDRAAPLVDARVVVVDAEVVEQREHLDGEGLVELEQADVVDRQPAPCCSAFSVDGMGPMPMTSGSHAREARTPTSFILGGEAQLLAAAAPLRDERHRRSVGERRGVAGCHAAVRTERRLRAPRGPPWWSRARSPSSCRGAGPSPSSLLMATGIEVGLDLARRRRRPPPSAGCSMPKRSERSLVRLREAVVDALGGVAHVQRVRVDRASPRGSGGSGRALDAHRVVPHVLDAAGDADVVARRTRSRRRPSS